MQTARSHRVFNLKKRVSNNRTFPSPFFLFIAVMIIIAAAVTFTLLIFTSLPQAAGTVNCASVAFGAPGSCFVALQYSGDAVPSGSSPATLRFDLFEDGVVSAADDECAQRFVFCVCMPPLWLSFL